MLTEWTGLKVDARCLDPRPPQMEPPNVYPEGIPFLDARPPQDNGDRLQDDTALQSVTGGIKVQYGVSNPNGQNQGPGALSPLEFESGPTGGVLLDAAGNPLLDAAGNPLLDTNDTSSMGCPPSVLEDDITFITGVVPPPTNAGAF